MIWNQHPWDTMCTNIQTKRKTLNFWAQICLKVDFGVKISKIKVLIRYHHPWDITCTNFQTNFEFMGPNLPKNRFSGQNFKNLRLDSDSANLRYCVCQFSNKTGNFEFLGRNLLKNGVWSQNFKNLSLDLESASLWYYVYQFWDKTDNFEFLGQIYLKVDFGVKISKIKV